MSSYLTFRYVEDPNKQFKEGLHHTLDIPYPEDKKVLVWTAEDIAKAYKEMFAEKQKDTKLGILLSGGMDSACLAAFLKPVRTHIPSALWMALSQREIWSELNFMQRSII